MIQQTSLMAYHELLETDRLGKRQTEVYKAILRLGNATNNEISRFTHLPINCVTPRCKELRQECLVMCLGVRSCKVTGRQSKVWSAAK